MQTRIISAFPGVGKTTLAQGRKSVLDLDSSPFSWLAAEGSSSAAGSVTEEEKGVPGRTRNPDFPQNYIKAIQEAIGRYEFILVSSHDVVRDALATNCLFYYLVYPAVDVPVEEYVKRYKYRGNNDSFIKNISEHFYTWIEQCEKASHCVKVDAPSGKYLSDMILIIEYMEK